jgi:hypothetical protein
LDVGVDPTSMRRRLQELAGIFKIIRFHSRVSEGRFLIVRRASLTPPCP